MDSVWLYIETYRGIGGAVIRSLDHPLEAADIDDYLIVHALEGDGGHRSAEHSLFGLHYIYVLGADDYIDALVLFKARVEAFEFVPCKFREVIGRHCSVQNI